MFSTCREIAKKIAKHFGPPSRLQRIERSLQRLEALAQEFDGHVSACDELLQQRRDRHAENHQLREAAFRAEMTATNLRRLAGTEPT